MSNDKYRTMIEFVKIIQDLDLNSDSNSSSVEDCELVTLFKELNSNFNSSE